MRLVSEEVGSPTRGDRRKRGTVASLSKYRGGNAENPRTLWRVQFAEPSAGAQGRRKRRTVYLGAEIRTRRAAEQWLRAVDAAGAARVLIDPPLPLPTAPLRGELTRALLADVLSGKRFVACL